MHSILIVDDDRMSLLIAKSILEKRFRVEAVQSGAEALNYMQTAQPDLVLLDVMMPGMNGLELLERMRALPSCEKLPAIFFTTDRGEKIEEACFRAGAEDYLGKPYLPSVLLSRVDHALERVEYRRLIEQCS